MREKLRTKKSDVGLTICSACGAGSMTAPTDFCPVCGKLLGEEYLPLDRLRASYGLHGQTIAVETEEIEDLFDRTKNGTAMSARACLVYSMVPYLGILFVPLTLVIGILALGVEHRRPELGGREIALQAIGLSFPVTLGQLFLWWLLYKIPEIGIPF